MPTTRNREVIRPTHTKLFRTGSDPSNPTCQTRSDESGLTCQNTSGQNTSGTQEPTGKPQANRESSVVSGVTMPRTDNPGGWTLPPAQRTDTVGRGKRRCVRLRARSYHATTSPSDRESPSLGLVNPSFALAAIPPTVSNPSSRENEGPREDVSRLGSRRLVGTPRPKLFI